MTASDEISDSRSMAAYESPVEPARNGRSGTETRARAQVINIRIDDDERARWTEFAQRHRKPLAGMLRLAMETAIMQDEILEAHRG